MTGRNLVKLKVDGTVYELDFDDLELDEIGAIEDLTGKSVTEIDWESARGLQGLAYVMMHRRDPRFTIGQAGKLKFSAFEEPEGDEAKKRPTRAVAGAKSGGSS